MRRVALFAAVTLSIAAGTTIGQPRNAVRIEGRGVVSSVRCFSLEADDDEEEAPGPQGTLPDDEQIMPTPPSTEPSPPDDDLPSEPAAAHGPAGAPAPPTAL